MSENLHSAHRARTFAHRLLAASLILGAAPAITADVAAPAPVSPPQSFPIGSIDFHGLRKLDADALRKQLTIHEGGTITQNEGMALQQHPGNLLPPSPAITGTRVSFVCCDQRGGMSVFVGVTEAGSPHLQFRADPKATLSLPPELVQADAAVQQAIFKAVQSGTAQEDDSQGHALLNDPAARALQEAQVAQAQQNLPLLRRVLRESSDGEQRAMAARLLGYAPDKQAVVDDLVYAMTDANEGVRNDAMRSLSVFSRAEKNPPHIPYQPFIALLDSPVWTDVNKSSFALAGLTAKRDPALLALLRERALTPLAEIARWHSRGHSIAGLQILGRIAGYEESDLLKRWNDGDTEVVIRAALGATGAPATPAAK